jgi:hypothetical protein
VNTDSCEGPGLLEKHQYLMNILYQHGAGDKPVIVTESGWYSNPEAGIPATEEVQARYVTQLFVQSKAVGLTSMIYFSLVDPDKSQYDYGLFTNPFAVGEAPKAKKAYYAYVTARDWLGQATYIRRLAANEVSGPKMDAYHFRDAAGTRFYVAWLNPAEQGVDLDGNGTPDTKAEFENLRLPHSHAEVYDIYGKLIDEVQDNDGDIRIRVGAQPVYIKIVG